MSFGKMLIDANFYPLEWHSGKEGEKVNRHL